MRRLVVLLLGLAACVPAPVHVREMRFPEGVLYVSPSGARVARECLYYALAAPRGRRLGGCWSPRDRTGWALDRPDIIAHERCHMLGFDHAAMAAHQSHHGSPC